MAFYSYRYDDKVKRLEKLEDFPQTEFFVVSVACSRSEYIPAYDERDYARTETVNYLEQYAVLDEETLKKMTQALHEEGKKFAFYHVKSLGKLKVQVTYDVDI